jgi:hypothetical protein
VYCSSIFAAQGTIQQQDILEIEVSLCRTVEDKTSMIHAYDPLTGGGETREQLPKVFFNHA